MINDEDIYIYGDGSTSRDFCYIKNVIQANILSALANKEAHNNVFNIACGDSTSLNELFGLISDGLIEKNVTYSKEPIYQDFRRGDVLHSMANIEKARLLIGYEPSHTIKTGMIEAIPWYIENLN